MQRVRRPPTSGLAASAIVFLLAAAFIIVTPSPAHAIGVHFNLGLLRVFGNDLANDAILQCVDGNVQVSGVAPAEGPTPCVLVTSIVFDLGDGDDTVVMDDPLLPPAFPDLVDTYADLGPGNDCNTNGLPDSQDVTSGGSGDDCGEVGFGDTFDGGADTDRVRIQITSPTVVGIEPTPTAPEGATVIEDGSVAPPPPPPPMDRAVIEETEVILLIGTSAEDLIVMGCCWPEPLGPGPCCPRLEVEGRGGADSVILPPIPAGFFEPVSGPFPGVVVFEGGAGPDVLDAHERRTRILFSGGAGSDEATGGDADDKLKGGDGPDILKGRKGDDILNGGPARDDCRGGAGNNRIRNCE